MDSDLHALVSIHVERLVVDDNVPIMRPIGADLMLRLGMEDPQFKGHLARIDP